MLLFIDREGTPAGEAAGMADLTRFAGELASQGRLPRAVPLHPASAGARVRIRDGTAFVTDGPFAESKEALGGFWIFEAKSRDEAIEIARRAFELGEPRPHARGGSIEVHLVGGRYTFPDAREGTPFLLVFRMEPGLTPDDAKGREMRAYGETLVREGKQFETAHLAQDPPPARIQSRRGKTLVTDGPFAETKDVVGGYSLVRAASRADAIELAKRFPHAKWGPVEVREMIS
jgi:hypothetical protein